MDVILSMYLTPNGDSANIAWIAHLKKLGSHLPGVTLSQTCGLPLVSGLAGDVRVVAVPKYNAKGCYAHRYVYNPIKYTNDVIACITDILL